MVPMVRRIPRAGRPAKHGLLLLRQTVLAAAGCVVALLVAAHAGPGCLWQAPRFRLLFAASPRHQAVRGRSCRGRGLVDGVRERHRPHQLRPARVRLSKSVRAAEAAVRTSTAEAAAKSRSSEVEDIVRHPRLPVWPVLPGIGYFLLDVLTGTAKLSGFLEDRFGGRVCPMMFEESSKDPFLLMVHHRHSFGVLDPIRYLFRSVFMPEGFPAHPHRGFETVTYVLRGGLVHRDSMGVKKSYGAPPAADGSGEGGAVQWMTAGRGILHEEMWRTGSPSDSTDQELYQIWVNLPAGKKMVPPRMQMLGDLGNEPASVADVAGTSQVEVRELGPVVAASPEPGVVVRVIAGEAVGIRSAVETYSPMTILHVTLDKGASWTWQQPAGWTCLIYVRRGDLQVGSGDVIPLHHTASLSTDGGDVRLTAVESDADLMLLAGQPLGEPVAIGGNIVMNTWEQLQQAKFDYRNGQFGPVWDHSLDDASWQDIVKRHWSR